MVDEWLVSFLGFLFGGGVGLCSVSVRLKVVRWCDEPISYPRQPIGHRNIKTGPPDLNP